MAVKRVNRGSTAAAAAATNKLRHHNHHIHNLSITTHIDNIITSCARVPYELRTLRSHGMPPPALHAVFSTAMAKVTYAAPAWWGFTNSADRNRLEAFIRRAVGHSYCADTTATLSSLYDKADQTLFDNIITNNTHPLHILLSPKAKKH